MASNHGDLLIDFEDETRALMTTLKRFDEDTFKIIKKELSNHAGEAKRRLVAASPVRTGGLKNSWTRKSGITNSKIECAVTIKWPPPGAKPAKTGKNAGRVVRYPFVLEHGRRYGKSSSGRTITSMPPRRFIADVRAQMHPKTDQMLKRMHDEAVSAFER